DVGLSLIGYSNIRRPRTQNGVSSAQTSAGRAPGRRPPSQPGDIQQPFSRQRPGSWVFGRSLRIEGLLRGPAMPSCPGPGAVTPVHAHQPACCGQIGTDDAVLCPAWLSGELLGQG